MKTNAVLLLVSLFVCPVVAQDIPEIKVETDPKNVTVYLDGAGIVRSKMLNLAEGKSKVIFEGLSPRLNSGSIQISTSGKVSLLAVSTKINHLNLAEESPEVIELKSKLEVLDLELESISDERDALKIEKSMLTSNYSIGGQSNGVVIAELKQAAEFYRSRIKDINNRSTALAVDEAKKKKEKARLNQELNELNAKGSKQTAQIEVLLTAQAAGTNQIEVKYLVSDAGWSPIYDLNAEDVGKPVELTYRAKLYNNTGVTWNNVKLHLSTADPTLSASKPNLTPWYLNFGGQQFVQNYMSVQNTYMDQQQKMEQKAVPGSARSANIIRKGNQVFEEVEISELSAEFDIKKRYTIPDDARPYIVEVTEHTLPATYKHFAAPKADRDAFLLARITGWEGLDLVAGPANVYFAGTYLGISYINTQNVNDTLDLSLGRDKKVLVKRNKLLEFCETKYIGGNKKESLAYEIIVKNNRSIPVNIEIVDQVPISKQSEITVDVTETSEADWNETTGALTWQMALPPGESSSVDLAYSIKYPKSKAISNKHKSRRAYAPRW